MKTLAFTLMLSLFALACSKEKLAQNAIISAMTTGVWKVVNFSKGSTSATADFDPYVFQFRENNTVDAVQNGAVEKTGTWTADANARTITSGFTNAAATLMLLNGTWKITNNGWTFVEASQTVNNETWTLRLEKR